MKQNMTKLNKVQKLSIAILGMLLMSAFDANAMIRRFGPSNASALVPSSRNIISTFSNNTKHRLHTETEENNHKLFTTKDEMMNPGIENIIKKNSYSNKYRVFDNETERTGVTKYKIRNSTAYAVANRPEELLVRKEFHSGKDHYYAPLSEISVLANGETAYTPTNNAVEVLSVEPGYHILRGPNKYSISTNGVNEIRRNLPNIKTSDLTKPNARVTSIDPDNIVTVDTQWLTNLDLSRNEELQRDRDILDRENDKFKPKEPSSKIFEK